MIDEFAKHIGPGLLSAPEAPDHAHRPGFERGEGPAGEDPQPRAGAIFGQLKSMNDADGK